MDQNGSDSSPTPLWCPNHCTWVMTVVSEASATFLKCWRYSACSAEIFSSSKRLYKRCAVCCNHLEDSKILEENCQRRRVATQPHSHVFLAKLYNWQSPKQLLSSVQLRAKLKHEKNLLHISFKPRAIRHACDPIPLEVGWTPVGTPGALLPPCRWYLHLHLPKSSDSGRCGRLRQFCHWIHLAKRSAHRAAPMHLKVYPIVRLSSKAKSLMSFASACRSISCFHSSVRPGVWLALIRAGRTTDSMMSSLSSPRSKRLTQRDTTRQLATHLGSAWVVRQRLSAAVATTSSFQKFGIPAIAVLITPPLDGILEECFAATSMGDEMKLGSFKTHLVVWPQACSGLISKFLETTMAPISQAPREVAGISLALATQEGLHHENLLIRVVRPITCTPHHSVLIRKNFTARLKICIWPIEVQRFISTKELCSKSSWIAQSRTKHRAPDAIRQFLGC